MPWSCWFLSARSNCYKSGIREVWKSPLHCCFHMSLISRYIYFKAICYAYLCSSSLYILALPSFHWNTIPSLFPVWRFSLSKFLFLRYYHPRILSFHFCLVHIFNPFILFLSEPLCFRYFSFRSIAESDFLMNWSEFPFIIIIVRTQLCHCS